MGFSRSGHIESLPSGSFRVHVYGGTDPLTGRVFRFRQTVKTADEAQIVLGRLLEKAGAGHRPDARVTVAETLTRYLAVAELDVGTRETYQGYVRRTILPALGSMELRKVRGPILDTLYTRLRRCGDLRCNGRPFTEHTRFPVLAVDPRARRPGWQQITTQIRAAITTGTLHAGDELPSIREMSQRYGLRVAAVRQAMTVLAAEGAIVVCQGRPAVVAGPRA